MQITAHRLQVHKLCQDNAEKILNDFKPNLMIAIGGGGYVPARILRYTFSYHPTPSAATAERKTQVIPEAARQSKHTHPGHWSVLV
jgi:hypoxanthine phosphoribosyltransferase